MKFEENMFIFCGEEETMLAVNTIAHDTVGCHVGFLPHCMTPKAAIYDEKLCKSPRFMMNTAKVLESAKFHHNLSLCDAAVISHLELNKS